MRPRRPVAAALVAVALLATAAGGAAAPSPVADEGVSRPALRGPRPCAEAPGFTCAEIRVPLDHDHRVAGTLDLPVAVSAAPAAPRGDLLLLTGGPGQPGVSILPRVLRYLDPRVLREYRLVVFDQRGTGANALDCTDLQRAVGGSDHRPPPVSAVRACAGRLGATASFYRTTDTVRDIDVLRRALGASRLTLDGVSYGTFTAEHYALTHPRRVRRLVLDSVVPHRGYDPLGVDLLHAAAGVLRDACAADHGCTTDPAADLAWVVRNARIDGEPVDGTRLADALSITSLSTVDPSFAAVPRVLHRARSGDTTGLAALLDRLGSAPAPAAELSAGLHLATTCADLRFPWGDASAPVAGRRAAASAAAARLRTAQVWPYDAATARRMLPIAGCEAWPSTRPSRSFAGAVLTPPALLVHGRRDLFCPVAWARWETRNAAHARLVVVPDTGHGVQGVAGPGRDAVTDFLLA